jgi:hypothetical protein
MYLSIQRELEKQYIKNELVEGEVVMRCSIETYVELKKAVDLLNRTRKSQRLYKERQSGKVNKARKPEIAFE